MLLEVSERLHDRKDITRLGLKLGIQDHIINAALANDARVTNAAHNILKDWFKGQNSRESAYRVLVQALKAAQLNMIIHDAL